MRRTPAMDPPEPPPPCPHCGDDPMTTKVREKHEHDDGAVTGDLVCENCEKLVEADRLLREPDTV